MSSRLTRRPDQLWQWWRKNYLDVARLCGLGMFVYAGLVDRGRNPALIPAATGLVFLKNAVNGGRDS